MGGMIAQIVAAEYPERVKSLVSLMSTSGDPALPGPAARVLQALLRPRPRRDPERGIAQTTDFLRLVGSPGFPTKESELRTKVERAVRRSYHPDGWARQLIAVQSAGSRAHALSAFARRPWSCMERTIRSSRRLPAGTPRRTFP